jgi:starvation-inducible DNA-binding protein
LAAHAVAPDNCVMVTLEEKCAMYDTKNDLPVEVRGKTVELLNLRLADAIDLGAQAKQAHWNVKGPNFIALHELFDSVAEHVEDQIDTLAERITALGGIAHGTVTAVARATSLKPYPEDITDGMQHVEALSSAVADFGAKVRKGIEDADRLGDADTSDLFTGISREADKDLWFLEAHLHARR